jgi:tetratricopeptide (TPR) repeat protein
MKKNHVLAIGISSLLLLGACQPENSDDIPMELPVIQEPDYEAMSLLGEPLYPPPAPEAVQAERAANLEEAIIWHGRRLGYMSRFREAISIFSRGLDEFPDSYKLLRHRGHRYISVREFEAAIADFEKARSLMPEVPETEPDGNPNALGIPLSNTQFNILYHLGLAHYLLGNWEKAAEAYRACLKYCENDDSKVATSDWLYMTYRKMGDTMRAAEILDTINPDMEIIENDSYFQRLLMYKGLVQPEDLLNLEAGNDPDLGVTLATQGYGVGNWYLANGDTAKAKEIFQMVIESPIWAAFGYIAAEAELAKMNP